jgi:hypothetical protein
LQYDIILGVFMDSQGDLNKRALKTDVLWVGIDPKGTGGIDGQVVGTEVDELFFDFD